MKKTCETCKALKNAFWYDWCMKYDDTCEDVKNSKKNLECWEENKDEKNTKKKIPRKGMYRLQT